MDEKIWEASKRGFPFNIPLRVIVMICLGVPLILASALISFTNT